MLIKYWWAHHICEGYGLGDYFSLCFLFFVRRHPSPPQYGSNSKFATWQAHTKFPRSLLAPPLLSRASNVTYVDLGQLAVPQRISTRPEGVKAIAESLCFTVRVSNYEPQKFTRPNWKQVCVRICQRGSVWSKDLCSAWTPESCTYMNPQSVHI